MSEAPCARRRCVDADFLACTFVATPDAHSLIRKTIRDLVAELDPDLFWQVHRSTLVDVHAIAAVHRYEEELYRFLETRHAGVLSGIADKKIIDDELKASIEAALKDFGQQFAAVRGTAAVA